MNRSTLDDCKSVSIAFLKKHKYLEKESYKSGSLIWSFAGEKTGSIGLSVDYYNKVVNFQYTYINNYTNESVDKDYSINLLKTPCNYGGFRYWFECPFCGRRVGVLYLYRARDFSCRNCLGLAYRSQNKNSLERMFGETMTYPELEEFRDRIRPYYKGQMTRNYKRYLKNKNKLDFAMSFIDRHNLLLSKKREFEFYPE